MKRNRWHRLIAEGRLHECRKITRHFFRRQKMMMGELEEALLNIENCPASKDEQLKFVNLLKREIQKDDDALSRIRTMTGIERPTSDPGEAAVKDAEPRDFYSYRFYDGEDANPYDRETDFSRFTFWNYEKALATSHALQWVARYLFDNTCPCDWPDFLKEAKADAAGREIALMMFEDFNRHRKGGTEKEKTGRECFGIDEEEVNWALYFKEENSNG